MRLRIPARSPDLNPVENAFHLAKEALTQNTPEGHTEAETEEAFAQRVVATLHRVAEAHAIESMPRRLRLIAASKGHRCAY